MKKRITLIALLVLCATTLFAQTVSVMFTGREAQNHYLPMNRVVVSNLTKGWQETLMWPDTVLVMTTTGIGDVETQNFSSLQLSQNNPNPFDGTTYVNLNVVKQGNVELVLTDIAGHIIGANNYPSLQPGIHSLCVTLSSSGLYFLTARQNGRTASVKMVNRGNGGEDVIMYVCDVETQNFASLQKSNACKGVTDNPFDPGDQMEYVGFSTLCGMEEESMHVIQTQDASQTILLSFDISQGSADAQPCPNTPIVTDYEGNTYNTVQIGNQCWMKENLRTTHYADGTSIPAGSVDDWSNTDPYYYEYDDRSGVPQTVQGYLYNWPAAIHGICPTNWHLPSYVEWMQLANYVSSQSAYVCGNDSNHIAKALASKSSWYTSGASCAVGTDQETNNATGFSAVPAGYGNNSSFQFSGRNAYFWSSSELSNLSTWYRNLSYGEATLNRNYASKSNAFSVRCLRD
jgi:uncharacterized protein (TIGR02145 family)